MLSHCEVVLAAWCTAPMKSGTLGAFVFVCGASSCVQGHIGDRLCESRRDLLQASTSGDGKVGAVSTTGSQPLSINNHLA